MITGIINLLQLSDWYKVSKNVDIAKGLYAIPRSWKEGKKGLKRAIKSM